MSSSEEGAGASARIPALLPLLQSSLTPPPALTPVEVHGMAEVAAVALRVLRLNGSIPHGSAFDAILAELQTLITEGKGVARDA